jgi:hypothetical protein
MLGVGTDERHEVGRNAAYLHMNHSGFARCCWVRSNEHELIVTPEHGRICLVIDEHTATVILAAAERLSFNKHSQVPDGHVLPVGCNICDDWREVLIGQHVGRNAASHNEQLSAWTKPGRNVY